MKYIIDTNVPKKASNLAPVDVLDQKCSCACLTFIQEIMESNDLVILDGGGEILKEYKNNFFTDGQDTVATIFMRWVLRNLSLRAGSRVELHPITKLADGVYEEYPSAHELVDFDPSDKKFIALSRAHPDHPPVVEGSDSLWWGFRNAIEDEGVHIIFLCEDYVRSKYEETHND